MSKLVINSAESLLSGEILTSQDNKTVAISSTDLINKIQSANIQADHSIISVSYSSLATLVLPDFTLVFVSDYGNNGAGSLWWKHPTLGFVPSESKLLLKSIPHSFKTTVWNTGNPDPATQTVLTFDMLNLPLTAKLSIKYSISCLWEDLGDVVKGQISVIINQPTIGTFTKGVFFNSGISLISEEYILHGDVGGAYHHVIIPRTSINSGIGDLVNFDPALPFTVTIDARSPKYDTAYVTVHALDISIIY